MVNKLSIQTHNNMWNKTWLESHKEIENEYGTQALTAVPPQFSYVSSRGVNSYGNQTITYNHYHHGAQELESGFG